MIAHFKFLFLIGFSFLHFASNAQAGAGGGGCPYPSVPGGIQCNETIGGCSDSQDSHNCVDTQGYTLQGASPCDYMWVTCTRWAPGNSGFSQTCKYSNSQTGAVIYQSQALMNPCPGGFTNNPVSSGGGSGGGGGTVIGPVTFSGGGGPVVISTTTTVVLSVNPSTYTFPAMAPGSAGSPYTFQIKNTGNSPSGLCTITQSGASHFTMSSTTCASIAANGTCPVTLTPQISSWGGPFTTTLQVSCVNGSTTSGTISVTTPAHLSISPPSASFGSINTGSSSSPSAFTITNLGGTTPTGCSVTLGDQTNFTQTSGSACASLATNASCTVNVAGTPHSVGTFATQLAATCPPSPSANASSTSNGITVSGQTPTSNSLAITPVNFTFQPIIAGGAKTPQQFQVTNTGSTVLLGCTSPVLTNSGTGQFSVSTNNCTTGTFAIGASCSFYISPPNNPAGVQKATASLTCLSASASTTTNGIQITVNPSPTPPPGPTATPTPSCGTHQYASPSNSQCLCIPPFEDTSGGANPPVCVFDPSHHMCDATSPVSPSLASGVTIDTIVNKKLACCLNQFKAGAAAGTLTKFDCIENASLATDFNALWADHSAADSNQMSAMILQNNSGQTITGFFTLKGERCNEFNEFADTIPVCKVDPILISGQQHKTNDASHMVCSGSITAPTNSSAYSSLKSALSGKKTVPTTQADRVRCPVLVRAAMVATCPTNPALPVVQNSYATGGVTRCTAASNITIHVRGEQVFEITGIPKMVPFDTISISGAASNIDVSSIIQNRNGTSCPPGSTAHANGVCLYQ